MRPDEWGGRKLRCFFIRLHNPGFRIFLPSGGASGKNSGMTMGRGQVLRYDEVGDYYVGFGLIFLGVCVMFFSKFKRDYMLVKAFKRMFFSEDGTLRPEGKLVLSFLRDEAGARGELGRGGVPYFYDAKNRFDANAAAFLLGKRRMFDLVVKYLALDEMEVFSLCGGEDKAREEELKEELEV